MNSGQTEWSRRVDAAGGFLPGVVVAAIPETGGDARAAMSGANGTYNFEDLPDGTRNRSPLFRKFVAVFPTRK